MERSPKAFRFESVESAAQPQTERAPFPQEGGRGVAPTQPASIGSGTRAALSDNDEFAMLPDSWSLLSHPPTLSLDRHGRGNAPYLCTRRSAVRC